MKIQSAITDTNGEIAFYLERIIRELDPVKVILFGSRARGEWVQGSDIDFAVVTDHFADTTAIYGAVDIVDMARVTQSLREQILKEGIVLYER